jgi:hypothetical protein
MSIFLNNSEISAIKLGNNNVEKIYLGDVLVFQATPNVTPTTTPTPTITPTSSITPTPSVSPPPPVLWSFNDGPYICNLDIDPATNKAYIANCGTSDGETNNVFVFDITSKLVTNNLIVGRAPDNIHIGGTKAIVSNVYNEDQTSSLIDLSTYNITTINRVNPVGLAFPGPSIVDITNNKLFISESDGLVVRDATTLVVSTTITNNIPDFSNVLAGVQHININPNTNKLYASRIYSKLLTIVNTTNDTVINTLTFDDNDNVCDIVCNTTTGKTYVSIVNNDNITNNSILKIIELNNNNTIEQTIVIDSRSISQSFNAYNQSMCIDEINNLLYISGSTFNIGKIYQVNISNSQITSTIQAAAPITDMAFNTNDSCIYAIVNTIPSKLQQISISIPATSTPTPTPTSTPNSTPTQTPTVTQTRTPTRTIT